ncbi:MAG TPA: hypothetical protein VK154_14880 [Chitinophagales bacterium]|nr:hypothetical protein [Chitinophagales bacterium]
MAITTDFIKRRELDLLPHTFDKPGRIRAAQKSIRYNILTMQQALFAYSITEYDLQTEVAEPAPYIPGEIELRLRVMWALIDIEKGRDSGQALATYHITAAQLQAYQQLWQGLTEDQKHLIARCAVGYSETNLRTIQNAAKRAVSNLGYSIEEAAAMYNLDNIFR